ncbi:M50 family metallopeptidase [Pelagicoccus sp. SDUM812002]|uniref:M50 family metallopeptidase n=1 Tax=Pelagicoccus sp. SDUM812002 TaxID=3041266 RepID=UPI00280F811B|nr:M50 family metallopeptidase [Pelagicoccus sp. SDUM812002]MDQ8185368.1 M50 family metallopeptidase [Pelagicoccus sp. SDUM812002]
MVLMIGKFACLLACYFGGLVAGVFLHELGHALLALLVTRQRVEVEVGSSGKRGSVNLGRLTLGFRSSGHRYGATRYDREEETRGRQAWVALGGPLASLVAVLGFTWLMVSSPVGSWLWVASLGLGVANFRIFIVAVWPIEYQPNGEVGEVWVSDGLDFWRLMTNKRDQ